MSDAGRWRTFETLSDFDNKTLEQNQSKQQTKKNQKSKSGSARHCVNGPIGREKNDGKERFVGGILLSVEDRGVWIYFKKKKKKKEALEARKKKYARGGLIRFGVRWRGESTERGAHNFTDVRSAGKHLSNWRRALVGLQTTRKNIKENKKRKKWRRLEHLSCPPPSPDASRFHRKKFRQRKALKVWVLLGLPSVFIYFYFLPSSL